MTALFGADHFAREDRKNVPARVRQAVLDRDGGCVLCGTSGENRLQLHHVVLRSQGGRHDADNLVVLCADCHRDVHEGRQDVALLEVEPGVVAAFPNVPLRSGRAAR